MRLSIAEIIAKTVTLETKEEKVEFLRSQNSLTLRIILKYTYDPKVEFMLPDVRPPWKKNGLVNVEGRLYNETRRLSIFLKGSKYDGKIKKVQVERLFIELLEGIDDKDAEIVANMIEKRPILGIKEEVVLEAFPNLYDENI